MWSICTVSKNFALELLTLCRGIGINIKIKNAGVGGWGSLDRWILTSRDISNNNGNTHYLSRELRERLVIINNIQYWLDGIEEINDSENKTFDISVNETHEYVANGVISHNTVSLLAMVSSGIHYPHSKYYIRRITIDKQSELIPLLQEAGYEMEDCITDHGKSFCGCFPKEEKIFKKSKFEASLSEQVFNAIDYQSKWSDNMVSITATFRKDEIPLIPHVLEFCEDKLKGISLLPLEEHGYEQAPFEKIEETRFNELVTKIKPISKLQTIEEGKGRIIVRVDFVISTIDLFLIFRVNTFI